MLVHKKTIINNVEYTRYKIKKLEWDLDSLIVGLVILYYIGEDNDPDLIKTHYFKTNGEVDVNELLDKVKKLHDGKI
jgi:hypothetical protein